MSPENLILVGFMGAGKSVVGHMLAKRLGRCFVETDEMITAKEGKSIPAIFAEKGEPYFRTLEAEALELLKLKRGDVIATGGGLPCRNGAMEALRAIGTVIWLTADPETLYRRASRTSGRPVLENRSKEEVATLLRQREPYYRQAHITVDTTALGLDAVVHRILALLNERSELAPRS